MAILDSSALIDLLSGTDKGRQLKEKYQSLSTTTTAICINEVLIGLSQKEREATREYLLSLEILPFDTAAAFKSLELENELYKKGIPLSKLDLFIASVCLTHKLPLITTDEDFKKVKGLSILTV